MASVTSSTAAPLLWSSSSSHPQNKTASDENLSDAASSKGEVDQDDNESSFTSLDWESRSTRTPSTLPPTLQPVEQLTISIHSDPPVPKLDLNISRRRTSSAPPTFTPKTSPSETNAAGLSTDSPSPLTASIDSDSSPSDVEKKNEASDETHSNE